jgi:hypothetical protein
MDFMDEDVMLIQHYVLLMDDALACSNKRLNCKMLTTCLCSFLTHSSSWILLFSKYRWKNMRRLGFYRRCHVWNSLGISRGYISIKNTDPAYSKLLLYYYWYELQVNYLVESLLVVIESYYKVRDIVLVVIFRDRGKKGIKLLISCWKLIWEQLRGEE